MGFRNRINNEFVGARDYMRHDGMDQLGNIDRYINERALNAYYNVGDRMGDRMGGAPRSLVNTVGELVHGARNTFPEGRGGDAQFLATRALQAGGVTVAGAQLMNLTHQMASAFGGPADQQERGTLPMY